MKIRKVFKEQLKSRKKGVNAAGAVHAVISANVNEPGSTHTRVSSRQRVVQRGGRTVVESEEVRDEDGTELPDREGTYDELREEATRRERDERAKEGE
ncbi:MAG TPA: hypothetical protein VHG69_05370, partial [Thermoleophilaceae bacterium]|nr:hypothetical protein [Thermoleophilaceae bacterium]